MGMQEFLKNYMAHCIKQVAILERKLCKLAGKKFVEPSVHDIEEDELIKKKRKMILTLIDRIIKLESPINGVIKEVILEKNF
mmetsp:Transcript_17616/g.8297  ORF Transcript_17616/g.8297 Transcript_17616/m.8297 type:complete len:82 (+) Transcript_17616:99-344(+)